MPTTIVKTVGTASRNYSTMQAWEDASPVNLVTVDQIWKGECYNDSEFSGKLICGGVTSDATRYPWLTTAAGESAYDDSANPLVYNQSKGVGVHRNWTNDASDQFSFGINYMRTEKIQWKLTNTQGGYYPTTAMSVGTYNVFKDGLIEANVRSGSDNSYVIQLNGYYGDNDPTLNNVLIVLTADSATDNSCSGVFSNAGFLYNVGVVVPTGLTNPSTGTHYSSGYYQSSTIIKSCYSFNSGGIAFDTGTWQAGSDYNASDDTSSPGANSSDSLIFASQFVSTTNTDWKLKSGSGLEAAGNTDSGYPNDIFGNARAANTGGDVGPHEFVVAVSGVSLASWYKQGDNPIIQLTQSINY